MNNYKYIFGPVNSRRFGTSLGIDLSPEEKSCNFDCLYCELEKSNPTDKIKNEPQVEDIIYEVEDFLSKNPSPDVITITANGEPTLYSKLEALIDELKKIKKSSKLLILSNASNIHKEKIQNSLKKLDIVKLSLDSANPKTFKKVDRPLKELDLKKIIDGIKTFRKKFKGTLVIEVLVVKNINDKKEDLIELAKVLKEIKPDRVDLGTVDRPPAYRVYPLTNKELLEISKYFDELNLNIIYRQEDVSKKFDYSEEEIINTLKRRPLTLSDIEMLFTQNAKEIFFKLRERNIIKEQKLGNVSFYRV